MSLPLTPELFTFRADKKKPHLQIFPPHIQDDPWTLFHGTSSCAEGQIETEGLTPHHLPVTRDELRILFGVYKSMNWRAASAISSIKAWSFPSSSNQVETRPIYMTYSPVRAAYYCGIGDIGGEAAGFVKEAIQLLRDFTRSRRIRRESLLFQLEEHEEAHKEGIELPVLQARISWVRQQIARLLPISDRLKDLRSRHRYGVVYAIRFGKEDIEWLDGYHDFTTLRVISPDRLIAKCRMIGKDFMYLQESKDRWFRDNMDLTSLIGTVINSREQRDSSNAATPQGELEWDRSIVDANAARDLRNSMSHEDLLQLLATLRSEMKAEE